MVARQAVHGAEGLRLRPAGLVLGDERLQSRAGVAGQQLSDPLDAEGLDHGAGLSGQPCLVGREAVAQLRPLGGGQLCLLAEQWGERQGAEGGQARGPGRVDPGVEGQRAAPGDAGQREGCDLLVARGQRPRGDGRPGALLTGEVRGGALVEGRQVAAGEEVVDLGAHGREGLDRSGRGVAQGDHGVVPLLGLAEPGVVGRQLGPEGLDGRGGDALGAAAVLAAADGGEDVADGRLVLLQGGRGLGHDPVPVEGHGVQGGGALGGVLDGDLDCIGLVEPFEHAPGGAEQRLVGDVGQRHRLAALEHGVEVGQGRVGPGDGLQQLGRADAPVAVAVDQREGGGVQLGALHGAGQRDPQLEVEVLEVAKIIRGADGHLVEAAGAGEAPGVGGHGAPVGPLNPGASCAVGRAAAR